MGFPRSCILLIIIFVWTPVAISQNSGCTVQANVNEKGFQQALQNGEKMLYMLFSFNSENNTTIDVNTPQPLTWVHVNGNHGKGLLWLRQDFEFYSLTSLSYDVDHLEIQLQESPLGCLSTQSPSQISDKVRDFILNDFSGFDANVSWTRGEICNARFRFINTGVEVYFLCCSKDESLNTNCYELKRSVWMNILLLCVLIFPLVGLMFAPLLIPYDLFRDSIQDIYYQYKPDSNIQIRVTKRSDDFYDDENDLKLPEKTVQDMVKFSDTLSKLQDQQTYDCTLEKIHFYVSKEDIIGQNADPFGPFNMLYDALARYEMRRRGICEGTTVWEHLTVWAGKLLNTAYLLLIIFLVNIPVIIRVIAFIYHNEPEWYITTTVEQLGLQVNLLQISSFGVSVFPRIELHIIYAALIGVFVIAQVFAIKGTHQVDFVVEIMKQCLRDSRKRRIKLAFRTIYKALKALLWKKRAHEYLLVPLYFVLFLPGVIINFIFYLLPTVNLFLSAPIYFFTFILSNKCGCLSRTSCVTTAARKVSDWLGLNYIFIKPETRSNDDEEDNGAFQTQCWSLDTFIIAILIFSMPVILFIVLDSVAFYIDIVIYLLVGLLLNASNTTTYVIIFLMLALYIRDLFDGVTNRYITFNNTIIAEAKKKTKGDVYSVSLQNENIQKNTAFQIEEEKPIYEADAQPNNVVSTPAIKLTQEGDSLKWKVKKLLFFLDKRDTPYVPREFFTKACNMDIVGAPGPLNQNLLDVFSSIAQILVFLLFILLVVSAFEGSDENFKTNQTLTAIAGGLIPWLFRKFLLGPTEMTVDVENLHFREVINDIIRTYEQAWTVADIEISEVTPCNMETLLKDSKMNTSTDVDEEHKSSKKEGEEPNREPSDNEEITTDDISPMIIQPTSAEKLTECIEMSTVPTTRDKKKEEMPLLDHLVISVKKNRKLKPDPSV